MVINVQRFVQRCDVFSNRSKRRSGTGRATGYAPSPGCRRTSDLSAHASVAACPTSASLFADRSRPGRGVGENAILHSVRHRSQAWSQTTPRIAARKSNAARYTRISVEKPLCTVLFWSKFVSTLVCRGLDMAGLAWARGSYKTGEWTRFSTKCGSDFGVLYDHHSTESTSHAL